ncbi:MAG TPA: DUF3298 and DUF4163 domain-containing protein [Ignavibacteriaceae bacterium]
MKKTTLIISMFVGITFFISCGSGNDAPTENSLKYELAKYEKQSNGCDSLIENNCAKIRIEFPQITEFENAVVMDKINNSIKSLFSMNGNSNPDAIDFNSEMDGFITDYQEFMSEFPDAFQSWFIERTGEVKLNKVNIFSIDYMDYSYTGGAHANTFVTFKNFNLSNGEEIKLDEIIPSEKHPELKNIGEAEFRKLKELTSDADLGQAGFWFENNKFYLNDNFLITDSCLVFYYNDYEITAYAFGPTELIIPYSKISALVEDQSPIMPFIK